MKTHDLAKALATLSKILKSSPNKDLEELTFEEPSKEVIKKHEFDPINLSSFVAFANFTKRQWIDLIKEYNLPLSIPGTDSARDVMGKIMKYFNENPDARKMLIDEVAKEPKKGSPELLKALSTLLRL